MRHVSSISEEQVWNMSNDKVCTSLKLRNKRTMSKMRRANASTLPNPASVSFCSRAAKSSYQYRVYPFFVVRAISSPPSTHLRVNSQYILYPNAKGASSQQVPTELRTTTVTVARADFVVLAAALDALIAVLVRIGKVLPQLLVHRSESLSRCNRRDLLSLPARAAGRSQVGMG